MKISRCSSVLILLAIGEVRYVSSPQASGCCSLSYRYDMEFYKLVFFFVLGVSLCYAKVDGADANINPAEKSLNSTTPAEKSPYVPAMQSSFLPTDLSWKTGFGQALIFVGAAAFSIVLLGGLTLLAAPVFGYKVCSVIGNCEPVVTPYSNGGNLQNPTQGNSYTDLYSPYYATAQYGNYRKRSLDYIKPIIETLASAYEKRSS